MNTVFTFKRPVAPFLFGFTSLFATSLLLSGCGVGDGTALGNALIDKETGIILTKPLVSCSADPAIACDDELIAIPLKRYVDSRFFWQEKPTGSSLAVLDVEKEKIEGGSWKMKVKFRKDLPPGTYRGTITLDLFNLFDIFSDIRPSDLQYSYTVQPYEGNLTPLAAQAGAQDWQSLGGNPAQNGLQALHLDVNKFTRRWSRQTEEGTRSGVFASQFANNQGTLFFANYRLTNLSQNPELQAWDESTGNLRWKRQLSSNGTLASLTVNQQNIWLRLAESSGNVLRGLDGLTGQEAFRHSVEYSPVFADANTAAPLITEQGFCAAYGKEGELECHDTQGNLLWKKAVRNVLDPHFSNWSPALYNGQLMAAVNKQFYLLNAANGMLEFQTAIPGSNSGSVQTLYTLNTAPAVLDANSVVLLDQRETNQAFANENHLSVLNINSRQLRWQATGKFLSQPVAANNMVYLTNLATKSLEARDGQTGAVRWSVALADLKEDSFGTNLVLTNNLLFFSGSQYSYALDLQSHQVVWKYPLAGKLMISKTGILYILQSLAPNSAGREWMVAFNLQ